ncbi:hypothetical protein ACQR35_00125 [Pseudarthrobacter sp. J1738]|uniref:hypothetical protein n=1 Tax=unclassified Pseudarthrobacter TaxID=2647000 RepID=UPI003D2B5559
MTARGTDPGLLLSALPEAVPLFRQLYLEAAAAAQYAGGKADVVGVLRVAVRVDGVEAAGL